MLPGFKVEIYIIKKLKKHIIPLLKLLERIIQISTDINDIVLDPMCGSGTTGDACFNLNRNCIQGKENDWCETKGYQIWYKTDNRLWPPHCVDVHRRFCCREHRIKIVRCYRKAIQAPAGGRKCHPRNRNQPGGHASKHEGCGHERQY